VSETCAPQHASELISKLRSAGLTFFPIRHHSPACAAHIERWILENRPTAVLVEGPSSFNSRIDNLTDDRCRCPVALYTSFTDRKGRLAAILSEKPAAQAEDGQPESAQPQGIKPDRLLDAGPPRFAAYYPFCDYSPELVALRTGKKVGAQLRFIDLEYGEMILAQAQASKDLPDDLVQVHSLADDSHLAKSQYIRALCREMGCRDFDELWDHLFESVWESISTDAFMDRLAVYCAMSRLDYTPEELARDATLAREACMAAAIGAELAASAEKVLVITGGFHTAALPDLVAQKTKRPPPVNFAAGETGVWLMRYSFDRLDALSGYCSGMPAPEFYDRLWRTKGRQTQAAGSPLNQNEPGQAAVAAEILVEISRLTRERKFTNLITTPDAIAAFQMCRQLAELREHPFPLREDLLDGIRSCFVKGEIGVEGQFLLRLVREVLAGNRVGDIPAGGDLPPIVDDFYSECKKYRLPVDKVEKRELALDLYRNATHRRASRFFHRLNLLGAPFARFVSGPDFVTGTNLDLLQEYWESSWSPLVESSLVETSIYGTTIEEAAAAKLTQLILRLAQEGQGRSAAAAVELLIRACRLGLHAQSSALVPLIDEHIAEDPGIKSVVNGLCQLELLQRAREPLEAEHLTAVPRLMEAAYQRACRLMDDLAYCPDPVVEEALAALKALRELLAAVAGISLPFDRDLFFKALERISSGAPQRAQSPVVGAAAGILYAEGRLSTDELIRIVCGYMGGAVNDPRKSVGILRGLLSASCEIAWQVSEVLKALDLQFKSWDEETFMDMLPELRLAFAGLTPRDIARVAEKISALHSGESLGELVHTNISEAEIHFGLALNERVRACLAADGLQAKEDSNEA
jgi:hypothetical protein